MAGHTRKETEGMLATLEADFKNAGSRPAQRFMQEILELVQDPKVRVVSAVWDRGLLNSGMAKYIAEEAMKLGQYDAVIWIDFIRHSSSPRKLQMRIAEKLGVQLPSAKGRDAATAATDEEEEDDEQEEEDENVVVRKEGARKIFAKLFNHRLKLLLVLDCVRTNSIDLRELGIHPDPLEEVKFVVMACSNMEKHSPGLKVDRWYDLGTKIYPERWVKYCVSETLVMGARDVADSLRMHHHITLEPTIILCCITYLLLMPTPEGRVSEEELSRYYMGEGFFHSMVDGGDMNIDRASAITKALLTEIVDNGIFKFGYGTEAEPKDIYLQMDHYLWEELTGQKFRQEYQKKLRIATEIQEMIESNCERISLATKNIETLPPTPPSCPAVTTLFLFGNLEMKSIPDDFFEHMTRLRVLDLSRTALTSLPSSISCLRNCLRFIKLQNCHSLETLSHSFKYLESLQLLDLSNTPLSTMPDDSFEHMYNLRLINLSHTKISSLSSSISNCCKLEQLFLKGCQSLETLPPDVFRLEKLQVFDISECTVLGLKEIPFIMPSLRVLNISKSLTQLASLSLKGFLSLETIQLSHLTNLEFLDLSNTKITEFPYEICEMTCLRHLDLVNTRQLKRVQWGKIKWLPKVLNWDQCGGGYGFFEEGKGWLLRKTQPTSINEGGSFPLISVSNASIFNSLEDSSPLWANCFTQFYIRISPCARQQQQQQQRKKVIAPDYASKGRFPYCHVYDRMKEKHATAPVRFRRYLEMDGVKSLNRVSRAGIKAIARQTELLWLHDNDFLTSLTVLDMEDSEIVEECRIERCHTMHNIFEYQQIKRGIRGLRRLRVSELLKLKTVYDGRSDFLSLQHLYLWWCPNLASLFDWPYFPNLETLEIRFCPRLECIYKRKGTQGEPVFPCLHTLYLWDLRKLEIVYDGYLPALKKLKVGRCPKLQKLPILPPPTSNNGGLDAAQPIEIEGESKWCDNIKWAQEEEGGTGRPINFKKVLSPRWYYHRR